MNPLLGALRDTFRSRSPAIDRIGILELRSMNYDEGPYVLIGYGVRGDYDFKGDFEDEQFGVFVANDSLTRVLRTLVVFRTPRWRDYGLRIGRQLLDSVEVVGRGGGVGDEPSRTFYQWRTPD